MMHGHTNIKFMKCNVLTPNNISLLLVQFIIVSASETPGNFAGIECFKKPFYIKVPFIR